MPAVPAAAAKVSQYNKVVWLDIDKALRLGCLFLFVRIITVLITKSEFFAFFIFSIN